MELLYWLIAGAVSGGTLVYLVLKGPARSWWQWALISLLAVWCVFGLGMAVTTYGEGNATGGNILLLLALGVAVVGFAALRFILRAGAKKAGVGA